MMTSWLVITRDPTGRQVAKIVQVVSGMLGWIIVFLLKKISRKNLVWLARTVGFSTEAPFWARNFSIFRNHENRGLKYSKNHVFSRFYENGGRYGFFRIFPITLSIVLVFLENKVLANYHGSRVPICGGGLHPPRNTVPVKTAPELSTEHDSGGVTPPY